MTTIKTIAKRIASLEKLCLSTTDPGDMLAVRVSDEQGCLYEVYAGGYPFNVHCRTAAEAREVIRDHYRALKEQGRM